MVAGTLPAMEFRRRLGISATGVTVITVEREPARAWHDANSFASVSLDPPLVSVCVDHRARTLPLLKEKQRFGVNVLKQDQQAFSEFFAQIEQSRKSNSESHFVSLGGRQNPFIENVLCQLSCKLSGLHVAAITRLWLRKWNRRNYSKANRCFSTAAVPQHAGAK